MEGIRVLGADVFGGVGATGPRLWLPGTSWASAVSAKAITTNHALHLNGKKAVNLLVERKSMIIA
jgi:hypothetical protein